MNKLKAVAENDFVFAVNEVIENKMMYYAGILSTNALPEATRIIQFPTSKYVVVKGDVASEEDLLNTLPGKLFGQALSKSTDYQYIGGPNTAVILGKVDEHSIGEMWIPVTAK